jgi:hypothetical protein
MLRSLSGWVIRFENQVVSIGLTFFSRAWISFPLETRLNPATVDLSQIMDHHGVMARFCCNVEDGVLSFRQVVADKNYTLSSLDPKARNKTRQGLENCTCGPEDPRDLATDGIALHAQTLRRQGTKDTRRIRGSLAKVLCRSFTVSVSDCLGGALSGNSGFVSDLISDRLCGKHLHCSVKRRIAPAPPQQRHALYIPATGNQAARDHRSLHWPAVAAGGYGFSGYV